MSISAKKYERSFFFRSDFKEKHFVSTKGKQEYYCVSFKTFYLRIVSMWIVPSYLDVWTIHVYITFVQSFIASNFCSLKTKMKEKEERKTSNTLLRAAVNEYGLFNISDFVLAELSTTLLSIEHHSRLSSVREERLRFTAVCLVSFGSTGELTDWFWARDEKVSNQNYAFANSANWDFKTFSLTTDNSFLSFYDLSFLLQVSMFSNKFSVHLIFNPFSRP